jgi:ketosteroid isomerase-like protein
MNRAKQHKSGRIYRVAMSLSICVGILLACAPYSSAQQKDKKKKKDASATTDGKPIVPLPDEQQIDYMISTMLGAWQLKDIERMHQCYADDVTFVSGIWAPPVVGWASYLPLYQQQRARTQQVVLERTNTVIKVDNVVAWATYQWDFSGTVDGQPMNSQGQTTLIMEKRNSHWIIVHNHTSVSQAPQPAATANSANTPSGTQTPASKPPSQ